VNPEVVVETDIQSVETIVTRLEVYLQNRKVLS